MDPISLDSIIISEDSNGDGFDLNLVDPAEETEDNRGQNQGTNDDEFDLNIVEPPKEFQTELAKDNVNDGLSPLTDNFSNFDVKLTGDSNINSSDLFSTTENKDHISQELNTGTCNSDQLLKGDNNQKSLDSEVHVKDEDFQISFDKVENDDKIEVDLFGAVNKIDVLLENENKSKPLVNIFTGEEIKNDEESISNSTAAVKKTIHPDIELSHVSEDLVQKKNILPDVIQDEVEGDFPDITSQHLRHDSSSGSEFDFELPQVKRKESTPTNDDKVQPAATIQPTVPVVTSTEQTTQPPLVKSKEQKTVTIETSNVTTIGGNFNNIASTARKIIEYNSKDTIDLSDDTPQSKGASEWDNVQTIEAGFSKEEVKSSLPSTTPLLSFYEMQDDIIKTDFSRVKPNIHTTVERSGFSALKHFFFGPPKMHRGLLSAREKVFCVAASSFDNSCPMHTRALQTIYKSLTGSRFDCSRFGSHWEEIGFQGNDPSTDLRGVGLLGLLNLIYILRDPKCHIIAKEIYKLSLHPTQNFPFCVMGINMSRITLQSLREDCLNKECNKREDVLSVVNEFYAGIYLQMYQLWKSNGKTISDSGFVIKQIETEAKKNPHHVFKNLEEYLRNKKSTSSVNLDNMDIGGDNNFLSVCDTDAGQY